jgi:hypothetical protein
MAPNGNSIRKTRNRAAPIHTGNDGSQCFNLNPAEGWLTVSILAIDIGVCDGSIPDPYLFPPPRGAAEDKRGRILRAEKFHETLFDFFVAFLELVRIRREKF